MVTQYNGSRPGTRQTTSKTTSRKQTMSSRDEIPEPAELRRSYEIAREEARLILEGEHDRLRLLRQKESKRRHEERQRRRVAEEKAAEEVRQRQAEAEAKKEAELAAKREAKAARAQQKSSRRADPTPSEPGPTPATETQSSDGLSKTSTLISGEGSFASQQNQGHHRRVSSALENIRQTTRETHARTNSASRIDELAEPQPPLLKPNFDAPISAVNAGERRVNVKCKDALITLSITPSTTVRDILNSASLCMSDPIDPSTAVLLESFFQLGLERPIRRYEHIRDVMNSWDHDTTNHLFILPAAECDARGLHASDAPTVQPPSTTVQIYHSPKPGKWDKKWLKLREDGQISTSKNEHGLDATNICHVSDFDLYTPTAKQMRKLKPPKKLCYALKSQEKAAVFLDAANYAHFVCMKDKDVADRWCRAVHAWRSWYLVRMLGEGERAPTDLVNGTLQLGSGRPGTSNSRETLPYVLGSFKPLLDFESSFGGTQKQDTTTLFRRASQPAGGGSRPLIDFVPTRPSSDDPPKFPTTTTSAALPPTAFPRNFLVADDPQGPFTGTGLLARSASRPTRGGSRTGHGVAGTEGKPLVDLVLTSEFTSGSLLGRMESVRGGGRGEVRIDRAKRREVDVLVGEGF